MIRRFTLATVLGLLALSLMAPIRLATAVIPVEKPGKGFKVLLPDNWDIITHRNVLEMRQRDAINLRGLTGAALSEFDLFAVPKGASHRYAENFFILSEVGSEYMDDDYSREAERILKRTLASMGLTYIPEVRELKLVDGVNWLRLRGAVDLPAINDQAVALIYVVPAQGRTFYLSFFASALTYDDYEPFFEAIATTFRPDSPLPSASAYQGRWMLFLLAGGLAGAGVGFVVYMLRQN